MSNLVQHSAADVLAQLLITDGLTPDPVTNPQDDWVVRVSGEPSSPDRCVTVKDTDGSDDGRTMTDGELQQHYGFQIRLRGRTYKETMAKAAAVREYLSKSLKRRLVALDGVQYFVWCAAKIGRILTLQKDTPQTKRSIVTLNALLAAVEVTAPTVMVEQAAGQSDPTTVSPVLFTATFSENVIGFRASNVLLSGTAGATAVTVGGGPRVYTLSVSGMSKSGTVVCSLPANAAFSDFGVYSRASTSTDNTVNYSLSPATGMALWLRSDACQTSPNCLNLVGTSSQSLAVNDAPALRGGSAGWTLEVWFNLTGGANSVCLFGKGDYSG
jgi:hypothetical protein